MADESTSCLQSAMGALKDYKYEEAISICLNVSHLFVTWQALKEDYDNGEAHTVLLQGFNDLGYRSQLVQDTRTKVKELMIASGRKE